MNEMILNLQHELNMLTNKLREVERLDMWEKWSHEDEERLAFVKAELKALKV